MVIGHYLDETTGQLIPVPRFVGYRMPVADADEATRLERQNVVRWTLSESAWSPTTALANGTYWRIPFDTETIEGDTYNDTANYFAPGVPGVYNLKTVVSFGLSAPTTTQLTTCSQFYRVRSTRGEIGAWQLLGGTGSTVTAAGVTNYFSNVTFAGADSVEIKQGEFVEFALNAAVGASITLFPSFFARFVAEKITDDYGVEDCD